MGEIVTKAIIGTLILLFLSEFCAWSSILKKENKDDFQKED
jgi:hypothetical protein